MSGRLFKLGDKVRIRQDLNPGHNYRHPDNKGEEDFYCNDLMTAFEGEIAVITAVEECRYGNIYNLSIDNRELHWEWTDDFLEPFDFKMNNAEAARLFLEKEAY